MKKFHFAGASLVGGAAAQLGYPAGVIGYTNKGTPVYPIAGGQTSYDDMIDRDDSGPIMLPESVTKEVIKSLPQQSAAFTLMRRTTMSSKVTRQPVLSSLPTAYWVGGDTGLKQTTKMQWANKFLIAEELAVIMPVPQAVLDDSAFPIWEESLPYIKEAAGALVDAAVLFGVGKPVSWTDDAIVPGAAAAGNEFIRGSIPNQDVSVDIDGEGGVMQMVEADGFNVNGFAADVTFKASLRGLRDANGQLIYQSSLQDGTDAARLEGERIAFINNGEFDLDEVLLIAGDWRMAIIGIRQDMTVTFHTEGVISGDDGTIILNLMQQDSAALRLVMRLGFAVANPISRRAPNEATRYPFAILRPTGFTGS